MRRKSSQPLCKASRSFGAFSLVEIVLALGIVSFAIVGIMGLFPVAMRSALESQRETRAAQIAQQIFSDLRSGKSGSTYLAIGTNIIDPSMRTNVNLKMPGVYQISYSDEGNPVGQNPPSPPLFRATVQITPDSPTPGLSSVQATIIAPASASSTNLASFMFSTLVRQQ